MEDMFLWALLVAFVCWCYRLGKRTGSRKGYHAGRSRARRRR